MENISYREYYLRNNLDRKRTPKLVDRDLLVIDVLRDHLEGNHSKLKCNRAKRNNTDYTYCKKDVISSIAYFKEQPSNTKENYNKNAIHHSLNRLYKNGNVEKDLDGWYKLTQKFLSGLDAFKKNKAIEKEIIDREDNFPSGFYYPHNGEYGSIGIHIKDKETMKLIEYLEEKNLKRTIVNPAITLNEFFKHIKSYIILSLTGIETEEVKEYLSINGLNYENLENTIAQEFLNNLSSLYPGFTPQSPIMKLVAMKLAEIIEGVGDKAWIALLRSIEIKKL